LGVAAGLRSWEQFLKVDGWKSDYESVDRFLRHYSRMVKSEKTRENICFTLKGLCGFAEESPDDLSRHTQKEASKLVQEYIDSLAEKGYSTRYVNVCLAFLKTFFKVNGFKGTGALEVERHYQPSRYRKRSEYIPTSSEIYNMAFAAGTRRNRALILSLYTSGLRNSTLRALLYGDLREELLNQNEAIKFPVYPEMKKIDEAACKGNIPYYSFISKDAVVALKEYLEQRTQIQGGVQDDEPLFASDSNNMALEKKSHTPVMKKSLEAMVKRAARKAGIARWEDVYPHCLRKAFESALRNAGLDLKDQEFLMGHILPGTQDTYYDKTKVEDLRRRYLKVNFFPERGYLTEDSRKRQILDTAKILGYPDDRIKKIEEALAKYEHVDDALEHIKKLNVDSYKEQDIQENQRKKLHSSKRQVRIIQGGQTLIRFMNDGWDLVKELTDDKFVMQKTSDESIPEHISGWTR